MSTKRQFKAIVGGREGFGKFGVDLLRRPVAVLDCKMGKIRLLTSRRLVAASLLQHVDGAGNELDARMDEHAEVLVEIAVRRLHDNRRERRGLVYERRR